jgi:hypothetical protein
VIDLQELWLRLKIIDIPIPLEIAFGMACIYVLLLGTARFNYEVRDGELRMRWRILGFIPFWSWRIEISRIRRLREFHRRDAFRNAIVFGRLPSRRPAILELNAGRFSLVYVTPRDRMLLAAALPGGDFE